MKKLLKEYSLNSDMQYFEMIVESYKNGQITQTKEQFRAMSKVYKKLFVTNSLLYWSNGLSDKDLTFFINLI